jgi:hypothetical protein
VLKHQERSPAWLARKTGVSEPMMYLIVDRKRTASAQVAAAAADALGVPLFLLFESTRVEHSRNAAEQRAEAIT